MRKIVWCESIDSPTSLLLASSHHFELCPRVVTSVQPECGTHQSATARVAVAKHIARAIVAVAAALPEKVWSKVLRRFADRKGPTALRRTRTVRVRL